MGNAKIEVVIFDMDGTIVDSPLDFDAIREEIGLRAGTDILQSIAAMELEDRERALAVLHRHERAAAGKARLLDGAREVLAALLRPHVPQQRRPEEKTAGQGREANVAHAHPIDHHDRALRLGQHDL